MANAFAHVSLATLRKVTSTSAEGWFDGGISGNPVRKGVLAVLDDALIYIEVRRVVVKEVVWGKMGDSRLASLVTIISFACLTWSHWGVVHKLQKMFSEASNDGELLAMLLESIELVSESCL